MTAQLKRETARSPWLKLAAIGASAKGHKTLWLIRAADPATVDSTHSVRILVLCRQHGDEPASTEAILGLLHRIANGSDPALCEDLRSVILYVVPMVNPDGADADTRQNGVGADLNRDWGIFRQPETRAVARAVALLRPHIVVDAHNWDGYDPYNANCLEVPRADVSPLARAAHTLQAQAISQLTSNGYELHPTAYGDDADSHLAHRYFAARNILSCLVETHSGSASDISDFRRRQAVYVALVRSIVHGYAVSHAAALPKLNRWEGYAAPPQEAILFPVAPVPSSPRLARAKFPPLRWLWAICAYALTLTALCLGRRLPQDAGRSRAGQPGRRMGKSQSAPPPRSSLRYGPQRAA